jgi:hypothetical protein
LVKVTTLPPEAAGCLSLVARHRGRRAYYPTRYYRDQKRRRKIQEKIDRLLAKAARYLSGRGVTPEQLVLT